MVMLRLRFACLTCCCGLFIGVLMEGAGVLAQRPNRSPGNAGGQRPPIKAPQLPNDPKLQDLHRDFIVKAERLATEYERKQDLDGAQAVYQSLLKLAPDHKLAEQALSRVLEAQAQDKKIVRVSARGEWQDTGVSLLQGKPVHLLAKGQWTVINSVGPAGFEIPKEMRPKDNRIKLGTLIGVVVPEGGNPQAARPFAIGDSHSFTASTDGRLFLRMFDVDPSDNQGIMSVMIRSSFGD